MVTIISSMDTSGGHQVKKEEVADFYCPASSLLLAGEQGLHLKESPRELTREPQRKVRLFSRGSLCSQASLVFILPLLTCSVICFLFRVTAASFVSVEIGTQFLNPLGPKSDQHQFSLNNISRLLRVKVMRINKLITNGGRTL